MTYSPIVVSLPIADRQTSWRFYRDALGLQTIGEVADDGVPEPLQFVVNEGVRIMLIPTGGFGWVIGGREVARPGTVECLLSLALNSDADVDRLLDSARAAGAEVIAEAARQPWGEYGGTFADPDGHLWMVATGSP